jgi:hypothetical protein
MGAVRGRHVKLRSSGASPLALWRCQHGFPARGTRTCRTRRAHPARHLANHQGGICRRTDRLDSRVATNSRCENFLRGRIAPCMVCIASSSSSSSKLLSPAVFRRAAGVLLSYLQQSFVLRASVGHSLCSSGRYRSGFFRRCAHFPAVPKPRGKFDDVLLSLKRSAVSPAQSPVHRHEVRHRRRPVDEVTVKATRFRRASTAIDREAHRLSRARFLGAAGIARRAMHTGVKPRFNVLKPIGDPAPMHAHESRTLPFDPPRGQSPFRDVQILRRLLRAQQRAFHSASEAHPRCVRRLIGKPSECLGDLTGDSNQGSLGGRRDSL